MGKSATAEWFGRRYSRLRCAVLHIDVSGDPYLLTRLAMGAIYRISMGSIRLAP